MGNREPFRLVRFGPFELNTQSGELSKQGSKIRIQQQPFRLLVTLLSRAGEVITRDELRQNLWPEDTFVDFEHGLNAAIKRLREALGDSADQPQYVETLARRGYRFVGPIRYEEPQTSATGNGSATAAQQQAPAASFPPWRSNYRWIGTLTILLLAALTLLAVSRWRSDPFSSSLAKSAPPPMRVVPFTSSPGMEMEPAFSPDGREIAYTADEKGGGKNLYVKLVGSDQPLKLTQGRGEVCCLAWSPDGRYIAFGRCGEGNRGLLLVPALGGPERRLSPHGACYGGTISWTPDGKFLALAGKEGNDPWSIFLFSLDTHESRKVTAPPPSIIGDHLPAVSPDGSSIAFRRINTPSSTDIYVQALAGGTANRLTFDNASIQGLAWAADGKSLVYASNRGGGMRLWRVPARGGAPEPLPVGGVAALDPAVSRQGNLLAYQQGGYRNAIWRVQISPVTGRAGPASKFIMSTQYDGGPQYSPDGTKIAFHSSRSGSGEVWLCDTECSNPIQLTSLGVLSGSPRWSPDATKIAFDVHRGGNSQIFVINAEGGKPRQVTTGDYEHSVPGWSRDGRWIYFASNHVGGWQLWKVSAQGGDAVQVTHHGGFSAFESPDGKLVYYTREGGPGIYQMPVAGGEERELINADLAGWGYWDLTGSGIYFIHKHGPKHFTIDFYDLVSRRASELAPVAKAPYPETGDFAVSPDGKSILYSQVEGEADIMLVENFR